MKKDITKYLEKKEKNIKELHLINYKLKEIPDLTKFINLEILNLSNNEITNIQNIPQTVHTLIISNNKIKKLINVPLNIKILYINKNLLNEINIIESEIVELYCDKNKLTTINYSKNLRILSCSYNKISNLDNMINTIINCNCSHNKIKYFNNLSESLLYFNCSFNQLFVFEQIPENLIVLNINNNKLLELNNLPNSLKELCCSSNKIKTLLLSENLIKFEGSYNNLSSIILNNKLQILIISNNSFIDLPKLPESLIILNCCSNMINKIILPINLKELYCDYCEELYKIYFNDKLEILSCDYTLIDNLDDIPNCILKISCRHTKITKIINIPNTLKYLDIEGNIFLDNDIKYFDLNIYYFQC